MLQNPAETTNKVFGNLEMKEGITKEKFKYFAIDFKKATNLGKLHVLPKIN